MHFRIYEMCQNVRTRNCGKAGMINLEMQRIIETHILGFIELKAVGNVRQKTAYISKDMTKSGEI